MKKGILCVVLVCFLVNSSMTQSINVAGVFPTIDHSGKLTPKLDYSLYYFGAFPLMRFQNGDLGSDPYFHLFYAEQAINYKMTERFSITGSYVYQRSDVFESTFVNENRFHIQGKYKQQLKKVKLSHRLRFDGRFIQDKATNRYPFTHRLRYLVGLELPFSEKFYFSAYEEPFFNTHKNAYRVYAENWFYIAAGINLNERNKLEFGGLYVTWNIGENDWFNQYYVQFSWINSVDLTKKKTKA